MEGPLADRMAATLRTGVRFHDGSVMTPNDVGRSILDTRDNPKSQFREYAADVSGYKAIDAETITVSFKAPNPLFPIYLSHILVMPEALMPGRIGRDAFVCHPIGTGPYRFVSWLEEDHLVIEAWSGFGRSTCLPPCAPRGTFPRARRGLPHFFRARCSTPRSSTPPISRASGAAGGPISASFRACGRCIWRSMSGGRRHRWPRHPRADRARLGARFRDSSPPGSPSRACARDIRLCWRE